MLQNCETGQFEPTMAYPGTLSALKRHKEVEKYLKIEQEKSKKAVKTPLLGS